MEEGIDKKTYEISFLSKTEEGAQEVLRILKNSGAAIELEGQVLKLPLAYPIKKEREAYFCFFHFSLEPQKIADAEQHLRMHPLLIRFLIVTPPFVKTKARSFFPPRRRPVSSASVGIERKQSAQPLSNEALERQLKEMQ